MLKQVIFVGETVGEAEKALKEQAPFLKETLFLAESESSLNVLLDNGAYAIAHRHTGNADEDFSRARYVFEDVSEIGRDAYVKAYQRCAGLPWEILGTERLRLRESTVDDVDTFYELYAPPSMTLYMEGLFEDPAEEKRYMAEYIEKIYGLFGFGIYTVILKETGEIIGRAGFSVREGFEKIELGFLIGVPWQGKGYAREVLTALKDYARDELLLDYLQAFVRRENIVSVALLTSLGMTVRGEDIIRGGLHLRMGMEL